MNEARVPAIPSEAPEAGLVPDIVAGFFVSLIALPLCLGIAVASGFPPIAGIVTAIVGGLVATPLGSAPMTIKGPAAGLIVVVLDAVSELGNGNLADGYRATLAVGVAAAILQIGLALGRVGVLAELFPSSVLQGLLAAIGVLLLSRQVHVLLGVVPVGKEPLALLAEIPASVAHANGPVVILSILCGTILLLWNRIGWQKIPAPLVVIAVAILVGDFFDFTQSHAVVLGGFSFPVGPHLLVQLPMQWRDALVTPDFAALASPTAVKYVLMLAVVGTIESLLSARAIDALDPWRRRPDLSRDLLSTGVGNLVASSIGGLPMISEVVRSSANVAAGGRSRWANAFHGAFLLLFVVLLPIVINRIPLAALAVMLVHTAARLASPGAFRAVRAIGPEQSAVFATTLLTTLASDLLIGVVVGLIMNALLCVGLGAPLRSLVRASVDVEPCDGGAVVHVRDAAVFANFLALRRAIPARPGTTVRIDFSTARVVDHTTLDRLDALRSQLATLGVHVTIAGLDDHRPISSHPLAARRRCA